MTQIAINRAPVLTLWAAVVAERLGHSRATALTLGEAIAGKTAVSKGQALGILKPRDTSEPAKKAAGEAVTLLAFMGRHCTMIDTATGPRAMHNGAAVDPASVERYLAEKFGDDLAAARTAMEALALAHAPAGLARSAYSLYTKFRPNVPYGAKGWGKDGVLDLAVIEKMTAARAKPR